MAATKNKGESTALQRRIITMAVFISFVVVLTFAALLTYLTQYAYSSAEKNMTVVHSQTTMQLENYQQRLEDLAYSVCYSPTVQRYFKASTNPERVTMQMSMKSIATSTFMMESDLLGIAYFDLSGNLIGRYMAQSHTSSAFLTNLPDEWCSLGQNTFVSMQKFPEENAAMPDCFALLSPSFVLYEGGRSLGPRLGTVALVMDMNYVHTIAEVCDTSDSIGCCITDKDGNILVRSALFPENYTETPLKSAGELTSLLGKSGWQVHSVLIKSTISSEIYPILYGVLGVGAVFMLLLVTLVIMLQREILRPIHKLSGFMQRVPSDKQPVRFKPQQDNELGQMINVMNHMLDELEKKQQQLLSSSEKIYETELARKQMEIIAYRNQINPHFLYNTLDCIRGIAFAYNAPEIVDICQSLSGMFRYAVQGGNMSTVEEEAANIKDYGAIIGYRFGHRIAIVFNADSSVMSLPILRLSLQPIVENAVFHGLEGKVGKGSVAVNIVLKNGKLVCTVSDNGMGIDEETLHHLQKSLSEACTGEDKELSANSHVGLKNIARRLSLFYGKESSLTIESQQGKGTTVCMCIDIKKESGQKNAESNNC